MRWIASIAPIATSNAWIDLRGTAAGAAVAGALALASPASAQLSYSNSTDAPVNETATPCIAPLLRTFTVPFHFAVADVNIGVVMAHTYRGDLRFSLVAPDATRIQLGANVGTSRDNVNVLFDDSAASAYTAHTAANDTATATTIAPPYQRTFRPTTALSAFNDKDAFGTWTLEICDSLNADSGTFFHSTLQLTARAATLATTKTSTVQSDPQNGPTNPKRIPGAVVRYCITITNQGPGIAANAALADSLPATLTYVPGSLRSGTSCAGAATIEDDDAVGADESDPAGASFAGVTVQAVQPVMANGATLAITFDAVVD